MHNAHIAQEDILIITSYDEDIAQTVVSHGVGRDTMRIYCLPGITMDDYNMSLYDTNEQLYYMPAYYLTGHEFMRLVGSEVKNHDGGVREWLYGEGYDAVIHNGYMVFNTEESYFKFIMTYGVFV